MTFGGIGTNGVGALESLDEFITRTGSEPDLNQEVGLKQKTRKGKSYTRLMPYREALKKGATKDQITIETYLGTTDEISNAAEAKVRLKEITRKAMRQQP